jgi:hypothetical protein
MIDKKRKLTLEALGSLSRLESKSPEFFCESVDMTGDTLFNYKNENLDLDILSKFLMNQTNDTR